MKKNLLFTTMLVVFMMLASTAFSQTARRITYQAEYAESPISVDGLEDATWSTGNVAPMDQVVEGAVPTAADASGSFIVLWDKENLYFWIDVTDDIRSEFDYNSETVDPWNWDNVEIFIGVSNSDSTSYVSGDNQYRFHAGHADLYNPWSKTVNENVSVAYVDNTLDYVFEIGWPWTELYSEIATDSALSEEELAALIDEEIVTGKTIEFEIQFADNDDVDQSIRQNVIAWNNDTQDGNSWNNTTLWGFLELSGFPTSTENVKSISEVKVYPTKVSDFVNLEGNEMRSVAVYNSLGQLEIKKNLNGVSNYRLNMADLSKGMYFIMVDTPSGISYNKVIR